MGNKGSVSKASKASSAKLMYGIGASMVSSNSGLSWFDHPINRENRNVVVNLLEDLRVPIIAVWLVSRPIDGNMGSSYEHWCVKIQAQGCLISIDFLESSGKGAYGLQQRTDIGAELEEFMYYGVKDKDTKQITKHKWEIISSVTPHPFRNNTYFNYLSDYDRLKLEEYIKNAKIAPNNAAHKFMKDIKCNKRVCDIGIFCSLYTSDNKGYNPLTKNCQQFAAELFAFLVGEHYKEECERVFERFQSPYDKKQWKNTKCAVGDSISVIEHQTHSAVIHKNQKHNPKQKSFENARERRRIQSDELLNEIQPSEA